MPLACRSPDRRVSALVHALRQRGAGGDRHRRCPSEGDTALRARAVHPRRLLRAGVEAGACARRGRRGAAWPASALLTAPARSRGQSPPSQLAVANGRKLPLSAVAPWRYAARRLPRERRRAASRPRCAARVVNQQWLSLPRRMPRSATPLPCAAARCRKPPLAEEASCASTDAIVDSVTWRRRSLPPGLPSLAAAPVLGLEPRWSSPQRSSRVLQRRPRSAGRDEGGGGPTLRCCTEDVLPSSQRRAPPPYCQGCG